jgi:hypothetical protein
VFFDLKNGNVKYLSMSPPENTSQHKTFCKDINFLRFNHALHRNYSKRFLQLIEDICTVRCEKRSDIVEDLN